MSVLNTVERMENANLIASMVIMEDNDGPFTVLSVADQSPEVMDVPPHMVQQLPMMITMLKQQLAK